MAAGAIAMLSLIAVPAFAQPGPAGPVGVGPARGKGRGPGARGRGKGSGAGNPDELRKEVMERMRAMRAWKLAEVLKLDERTSAKLFPLLTRFDDRQAAIGTEMGAVMRGLRAEVEAPKPDTARIKTYIDKLLKFRGQQRSLEDDKIREIRKILSPVQQAKLVILMPRIEHHFQQRIREAMGRGGRRGGGDDGLPDDF